MDSLSKFADVLNLILDVPLIILAIKLVLRTEKALDKVVKFLLFSIVMSATLTLLTVNRYFGIVSSDMILVATSVLRVLFLLSFIAALYTLLQIVDGKSKG